VGPAGVRRCRRAVARPLAAGVRLELLLRGVQERGLALAVGLPGAPSADLFRPGTPLGRYAAPYSREARPLEHHVSDGYRLHEHRPARAAGGGSPSLPDLGEGART